MSFLRSRKFKGSKPISKSSNSAVVSSNGRVVNPFQDTTNSSSSNHSSSNNSHSNSSTHKPPPPSSSQVISVALNNTAPAGGDLPNARKMIVLQEYNPPSSPGDTTKGLHVRRGETVSVLSQQQDWCLVRNERGKEGYVPCAHLVAPYSTMRSRQKFAGGGGPIRPVASGSSIEVMDHASIHGGVPMYPSRSAGRPRNHSLGDENRIYNSMSNVHQRVYSPQEVVTSSNHYHGNGTHTHGNINHHHGNQGHHHGGMVTAPPTPAHQGTSSTYDQKYSPSTSSGVASLTGTGSPVMRSDGSQHSSFCSIEEQGTEGRDNNEGAAPGNLHNGTRESSRDVSSMRGRATSETNIAYSKHGKPAVFPPREPRPLSTEQPHPEGEMVVNNDGDTPPPLPPRSYYCNINSHSNAQQQNVTPVHAQDQFVPPPEEFSNPNDETDPYSAPMDAIPRSPHLGGNQPHLRNGTEIQSNIHTGDDHGVYSEVYPGYQRPYQHYQRLQNGFHLSPNGTEEGMYSIPPSEGSSSNSQVSRHSHVSSSRTQGTERPFHYSRDAASEITPNGDQNEVMGMEYSHRPSSMTQFGAGQIKTFRKNLWGLYTVVDNFNACDENELSVQEGDHVSVWNQDDPEWYWIVKHDTNEEGFVPSCCLKEIVSDTHGLAASQAAELPQSYQGQQPDSMTNSGTSSSSLPPPLPPKQPQLYPKPPAPKPPRPPPAGASFDHQQQQPPPPNSHHQRFRDRATSHNHRPSSIPPPGNIAGGYRRRLNSDGSSGQNGSLRGQTSATSIEKRELSISPPNSPPPPYSKYDHGQSHQQQHQNHVPPPSLPAHAPNPQPHPPRHNSVSHHDRPTSHSHVHAGYSAPMQRTYSQGQVPYRRVHIPHSSSGSGNRLPEEDSREDGVISPPDVFADGGTLV